MYIYIHIPFCTSICSYCDFPKLLYCNKYIDKYLDSLEKEIKSRYNNELVKSIYIGGGTPTSLSYNELERLLIIINNFNIDNDIEYTIESNVESLDIDKIKLLNKYNVNRVSLGVQSFDDNVLKELNRHHTKDDVYRVINELKKNNITNINIDLIYGVNDNLDILKKDIEYFLELNIPHISCYSLIIENNTLFGINNREYIDDNIDFDMYKYIEDKLTNNNYIHYEVSNYSKNGYQSIHNLNYWNNLCYYGFGMGAVSYIDNYRISNTKNLSKYLNGEYIDNTIYEDEDIQKSNTLILGLRKVGGINVLEFKNRYNKDIRDCYNIKELIKDNKLILKDNYLYINPKYFYLSNDILINFI
ncbi:MAG: radical SAM family heme chaperone HemW [Bacilli bacterium]|nr:radical SAM family heme chaperone HemW [Bacilli bacterium]